MSRSDNNTSMQFQKWQKLVDNDLKWITTRWFQKILLDFFKEHSMAYLDNIFVNEFNHLA
jgi:hypothetical protein